MSDTNMNMPIQAFANPEFGEIRCILIDDEPWLVGKDVAEALGYSNIRDALAKHVDNEDKNTVAIRDGIQGNPNMTVINESGLYSLILSSKLPDAKKFKRWVTSEVLPAIRKTGIYQAPGSGPRMTDLEIVQELAKTGKDQMPVVLEFLRLNGYNVPTTTISTGNSAQITGENTVQAFADEILPQSQWDLLPFGVLYELYTKWHERNQIPGNLLGRNTFICKIAGLADTGRLPGWRCPGRSHPVRPKQRMAAPEPVITYALSPQHLVQKTTYTGLVRI